MTERKTLPDVPEPAAPLPKRHHKMLGLLFRFVREIIILAVLMVIGLVAIKWWNSKDLLPTDGTLVEPFLIRTPDGVGKSIADFRGKAVLLHFWAPWCGVCKMEVRQLNSLHDDLPANAALVAVALDGSPEEVAAFVKAEGVRYPVYLGDDQVGRQMQIRQFPTTYVLNRQGRIIDRDAGWSPAWNYRRMLTGVE
ncbi:MAG: TlpA family protein disulfide reductase [Myxococcales bacterium]|nr:TlpA family protein disulfide reductase [Myxococcales bacterium]